MVAFSLPNFDFNSKIGIALAPVTQNSLIQEEFGFPDLPADGNPQITHSSRG
jgi:hypothetical protein